VLVDRMSKNMDSIFEKAKMGKIAKEIRMEKR